jgi:hypothetical protein
MSRIGRWFVVLGSIVLAMCMYTGALVAQCNCETCDPFGVMCEPLGHDNTGSCDCDDSDPEGCAEPGGICVVGQMQLLEWASPIKSPSGDEVWGVEIAPGVWWMKSCDPTSRFMVKRATQDVTRQVAAEQRNDKTIGR